MSQRKHWSLSPKQNRLHRRERRGLFDLPNGICICPWGLPDSSTPNIVAFPPKGLEGHYKLFRRGGQWGVSLVESLGLGEQSAYSAARTSPSTR